MNFINDYSAITGLLDKNRTWKLLRSDNAPLVIAFLKNIFRDEREISYEKARAELKECFQDIKTTFGTEVSFRQSSDYLRHWMEQGWIVEMDGSVTMTDAAQKAIDFTQMLESPVVSTSATHLQILQNEVKQLFIDVSTDKKVRIGALLKQKRELESRIDAVKMGGGSFLTPAEQRERMRTIYELAERLPADFRNKRNRPQHPYTYDRALFHQGTGSGKGSGGGAEAAPDRIRHGIRRLFPDDLQYC